MGTTGNRIEDLCSDFLEILPRTKKLDAVAPVHSLLPHTSFTACCAACESWGFCGGVVGFWGVMLHCWVISSWCFKRITWFLKGVEAWAELVLDCWNVEDEVRYLELSGTSYPVTCCHSYPRRTPHHMFPKVLPFTQHWASPSACDVHWIILGSGSVNRGSCTG